MDSLIEASDRCDARQSRDNAGGTLAFLHIPKCAGTSVMDSVALLIKGRHVGGFDRCLFGDFEQFDTIPKMMREVIYLDPAEMPADARNVMGHFAFSTLQNRYADAKFAVFLREPWCRLLSHWVYWRSLTWFSLRHWGPEWSARVKLARLPLREFLAHPGAACQTDNVAIRMLVWPHAAIPGDAFIDPANDSELLEIALKNLQSFGFAGITERGPLVFHEFSDWLGIRLDLPTLNPARRMRRAARARLDEEFAPATLALLRARSRLDNRLWMALAARHMSGPEAETLRHNAILKAVARFSLLLA